MKPEDIDRLRAAMFLLTEMAVEHPAWPTSAVYETIGILRVEISKLEKEEK